ncbi:hypothetical protein [Spirosoma foliorum]|uniref:Uncharacterized protein n=1 Tax=Spirosoma foliorum TaxID=2710596 RepID=A0A7G5GWS8_9BACT|nr:hypothetical protein [Spirosoma foliorum]QMW03320.1 hypothetical protein H3H32_36625 [Spirosoma foliorum]
MIDRLGVSGEIYGANLMTLDEGDLNGWDISLDEARINLVQSRVTSGSLKGGIRIAIMAEREQLGYVAVINPMDDYYAFTVSNRDAISFSLFKTADLKLYENSSITLALKAGQFNAHAVLNGEMKIAAPVLGTELASFQFERLELFTYDPYLTIGALQGGLNGQVKFGTFPATIDGLQVAVRDGNARIGIGLGLNFDEIGANNAGNIKASGSFDIIGHFENRSGRHFWVNDRIGVGDVRVSGEINVLTFSGMVHFFEDDPDYGKGFQGSLNLTVGILEKKIEISSLALFGSINNYRYWYVDGSLTGITIPIAGGIAIKGMAGGGYRHMKPYTTGNQGSSFGRTATGLFYRPTNTVNWGAKFSLFLGPTAGDIFRASAGLEIAMNNNGGLDRIGVLGSLKVVAGLETVVGDKVTQALGKMIDLSNAYTASIADLAGKLGVDSKAQTLSRSMTAFLLDNGGFSLNADLALTYDVSGHSFFGKLGVYTQGLEDILSAHGEGAFYFGPDKWFVHIGKAPLAERIRVHVLAANATAYFMLGHDIPELPTPEPNIFGITPDNKLSKGDLVDARGMAFGASLTLSSQGDYKIVSYDVGLTAGFDIMIKKYPAGFNCVGRSGTFGLNSWRGEGQLYAGAWVKFSAFMLPVIDMSLGVLFQVKAPNPSWVMGVIAANLWGMHFDVRVQAGDKCELEIPENYDVSQDYVLIENTYPQDGEQNVSVLTTPRFTLMNEPEVPFTVPGLDGRSFRVHIEKLELKTGDGTVLTGSLQSKSGSKDVAYALAAPMPANSQIRANLSVVFQELIAGEWKQSVKADGSPIRKDATFTFFTGDQTITRIDKANIESMYPASDQYNVYTVDRPKGQLILSNQVSAFTQGGTLTGQLIPRNGGEAIPLILQISDKTITYDFPSSLQPGGVYELKLTRSAIATSPEVDLLSGQYFRVSRYGTFADKAAALAQKLSFTKNLRAPQYPFYTASLNSSDFELFGVGEWSSEPALKTDEGWFSDAQNQFKSLNSSYTFPASFNAWQDRFLSLQSGQEPSDLVNLTITFDPVEEATRQFEDAKNNYLANCNDPAEGLCSQAQTMKLPDLPAPGSYAFTLASNQKTYSVPFTIPENITIESKVYTNHLLTVDCQPATTSDAPVTYTIKSYYSDADPVPTAYSVPTALNLVFVQGDQTGSTQQLVAGLSTKQFTIGKSSDGCLAVKPIAGWTIRTTNYPIPAQLLASKDNQQWFSQSDITGGTKGSLDELKKTLCGLSTPPTQAAYESLYGRSYALSLNTPVFVDGGATTPLASGLYRILYQDNVYWMQLSEGKVYNMAPCQPIVPKDPCDPLPSVPQISADKTTICIGQSVILTAQACELNGVSGEVTWSTGKKGRSISVSPTITTTYTAVCNFLPNCPTQPSNEVVITVNGVDSQNLIVKSSAISADVSRTQPIIVEGTDGQFFDLTADGCTGTVKWSVNQNEDASLTGLRISVQASQSGGKLYTFTCEVDNCSSQCSIQSGVIVQVKPEEKPPVDTTPARPVLALSAGPQFGDAANCNQSQTFNYKLYSTSTQLTTGTQLYTTDKGDDKLAPSAYYTLDSGQWIHLNNQGKVDQLNNCGWTSTPCGTLPNAPSITADQSSLCRGASVGLTASGCEGGTITWSDGQTGSRITVSPSNDTNYTARCSVKEGCPSEPSNELTISIKGAKSEDLSVQTDASFIASGERILEGTDGQWFSLRADGCTGTVKWFVNQQENSDLGNNATISVQAIKDASRFYTFSCEVDGCSAQCALTSGISVRVTPDVQPPVVVVTPNNWPQAALSSGPTMGNAANCADGQTFDYKLFTENGQLGLDSKVYSSSDATSPVPSRYFTLKDGQWIHTTEEGKVDQLQNCNWTSNPCGTLPNAPSITADQSSLCRGASVGLTASGCEGGTITWSDGQTGSRISVSPSSDTNYTARCSVKEGCLSSPSNELTISIKGAKSEDLSVQTSASFASSGGRTLEGTDGQWFDLRADGCPNTVKWFVNQQEDTGLGINSNISVQASEQGKLYTFSCESEGCSSQCSTQDGISVRVAQVPPVVVVTPTNWQQAALSSGPTMGDAANCADGQTFDYKLYTENGQLDLDSKVYSSSDATSPVPSRYFTLKDGQWIHTTEEGKVDQLNNCGWTSTPCGTLPNAPSITADQSSLCRGASVGLTASGCEGGTITWSDGQTGSRITVSPSNDTNYTARCSVKEGCPSEPSNELTISIKGAKSEDLSVQTDASFIASGERILEGTDGQWFSLRADGCTGTVKWFVNQQENSDLGNNATISVQAIKDASRFYTFSCEVDGCSAQCALTSGISVRVTPDVQPPVVVVTPNNWPQAALSSGPTMGDAANCDQNQNFNSALYTENGQLGLDSKVYSSSDADNPVPSRYFTLSDGRWIHTSNEGKIDQLQNCNWPTTPTVDPNRIRLVTSLSYRESSADRVCPAPTTSINSLYTTHDDMQRGAPAYANEDGSANLTDGFYKTQTPDGGWLQVSNGLIEDFGICSADQLAGTTPTTPTTPSDPNPVVTNNWQQAALSSGPVFGDAANCDQSQNFNSALYTENGQLGLDSKVYSSSDATNPVPSRYFTLSDGRWIHTNQDGKVDQLQNCNWPTTPTTPDPTPITPTVDPNRIRLVTSLSYRESSADRVCPAPTTSINSLYTTHDDMQRGAPAYANEDGSSTLADGYYKTQTPDGGWLQVSGGLIADFSTCSADQLTGTTPTTTPTTPTTFPTDPIDTSPARPKVASSGGPVFFGSAANCDQTQTFGTSLYTENGQLYSGIKLYTTERGTSMAPSAYFTLSDGRWLHVNSQGEVDQLGNCYWPATPTTPTTTPTVTPTDPTPTADPTPGTTDPTTPVDNWDPQPYVNQNDLLNNSYTPYQQNTVDTSVINQNQQLYDQQQQQQFQLNLRDDPNRLYTNPTYLPYDQM